MGLFSKREPCAICGGKVSGLFPGKIQGRLVCGECHGNVDLPDGAATPTEVLEVAVRLPHRLVRYLYLSL
jgi:hypothetical protein